MLKHILIVDDSATSRMVIRKCLSMGGYQGVNFIEAANGVEALDLLNDNDIDLILTDLVMPEMDGEELGVITRQSDKLKTIPIIVISSIANPAYESKLMSLGASAVLNKPLSPMALDETVKNVYNN